jgi:hypothetical protein
MENTLATTALVPDVILPPSPSEFLRANLLPSHANAVFAFEGRQFGQGSVLS